MRKTKASRRALFTSIVSLLLCFTMLLGTTYAWFTDSVASLNNKIVAGNLDVEMDYYDVENKKWVPIGEDDVLLDPNAKWEPGYTEVVYLRVRNEGSLALKYNLGINISKESGSVNIEGDSFLLSDYIEFGIVDLGDDGSFTPYADRNTARDAVKDPVIISKGYSEGGEIEVGKPTQIVALVVYMPEDIGNEANFATGEKAPEITLGINLLATQMEAEFDSFGKDYDASAGFPAKTINVKVSAPVSDKAENGVVTETISIGSEESDASASVPENVALADGATELTLSVTEVEQSEANIAPLSPTETADYLDVHIEGVAENNTTPMLITLPAYLPTGLNSTSYALYHVENGVTVQMTPVTTAVNHNEFSYDPATGDVVLALASFSEVVTVTDNLNPWTGTANTDWYTNPENSEYYEISTAEELAGLGILVNNGTDDFSGKTVKLGADIDLGGKISFNPIGCGYDASTGVNNSNGVTGYAFKGTFDGQGYTIRNLYQNGWDLELSYCNLGGGLFASVCNANIQNLTISGANIVMECVEMGIVAGLAQGNCTFENIKVYDSKIANYQRATGGIVGEVSPVNGNETCTFNNITIGSDVVVGSLWGDFDCPVGGVVGARWDDGNTTKIHMENVSVACRLDVYNDVTSSYQWYAYRRAGMLIGNTDTPSANGKDSQTATADFLTCTNVEVWYGPWVNYTYCEFAGKNWPWVRVQAGENCDAYSNPRYGHPTDANGNTVVDDNHTHNDGEGHLTSIPFNQLYGGGQGVYGEPAHSGVEVKNFVYTIQYINDNEVLAEQYVESNGSDYTLDEKSEAYATAKSAAEKWVVEQGYANAYEFGGWMNAGSTKVTQIKAGNTELIKLFPYFVTPHTARFVDQNGNVLAWCLFSDIKTSDVDTTAQLAQSKLVIEEGFSFDKWEVHITNDEGVTTTTEDYKLENFASYETDVTIYPVFKYNGDVSLIPVDEDGDGDTDYYQVGGYGADTGEQELVEIPGVVNGVPVTEINADAFSSYDDLHSVRIPATVEVINSQAFTANQGDSELFPDRDTVTLYYEGDPETWEAYMKEYSEKNYTHMKEGWDNNMGDGSRVFFLDANGKVDESAGYWELNSDFVWIHHMHAYSYEAALKCAGGEDSHHEYGGGFFGWGDELKEEDFIDYDGTCDCDSCGGATRPDAEYWTTTTTE